MHVESTESTSDHFVSINRDVRVVNRSMHGYGDLGGVGELLRAYFHFSTGHENVIGIEISVMVWIRVGDKQDRSFTNDSIDDRTTVDINQKVQSLRDPDRFSVHWCELSAPSGVIRPKADIQELKLIIRNKSLPSNEQLCLCCYKSRSTSRCASYRSRSCSSHWAIYSIQSDSVKRSVSREIRSAESD